MTRFLAPSEIFVGDRLRGINRPSVEGLKESIARIGLRTPISVRQIDGHDEMWGLVTGMHRLQACIELGFERVEVREEEGTEDDARLWEIDENLCRAELSELERGEHTKARKEIYERLHPETKASSGAELAAKRWDTDASANFAPAFTEDTAAKTGKSERAIQLSIHRAENISQEVRDEIRGTDIADSGVQLDALTKATHEQQAAAVAAVKSGEVKDVRDVLQPEWRAKTSPARPSPIVEPPQRVASPEPEGEPLPAGMTKWVATFNSWTLDHQEIALRLLEVDEDTLAELRKRDDVLMGKNALLDAQRERITQLEQENQLLQERLASQPTQAEQAGPEVTEPDPEQREPVQSLSVEDQTALRVFQELAAAGGARWIGVAGREKIGIGEDTVDRLRAAGIIGPSPGNPHAYGIPVEELAAAAAA
jgi:ParB-like chromosome segregation protein Spo0J